MLPIGYRREPAARSPRQKEKAPNIAEALPNHERSPRSFATACVRPRLAELADDWSDTSAPYLAVRNQPKRFQFRCIGPYALSELCSFFAGLLRIERI